ncbi:MAG TPA: DUF1761 domain-containing protein [Candidatus Saccharimonadales bacterium]|nr:DUF1761 domain-containing protein [Candidatus Saccharimonadales bacterium]
MEVEVNWLAVLLATASSMVVGSIWYAPSVFGRAWEKMVHLDEKKKRTGAAKAIGVTLVVSFLTAYILAHVSYLSNTFFGNSFLHDSLMTAFWAWLGFTAARFITHDAFEQRPFKLTAMNIAHELATFLAMGLIIGLLHP